jgi:ParB family chromosome partitioning protein
MNNKSVKNNNCQPLMVDINKITPNPDQPRQLFNKNEITNLANSIKAKGIIEPLVVLVDEKKEGYQLLAGHRRLLAATEAGLDKVPIIIINTPNNIVNRLEIALLENIIRSDLNPIEEAEGYSRLEKDLGGNIEDISQLFGKDRSTIINSIRLLNLPEPIKDDIRVGRMTAGHGRAILSIKNPKYMIEARNLILTQSLSVRETEKLAKKFNKKNNNNISNKAFYESLESSFSDCLGGVKVSIKYNKNNKRIDIYINNDNEIINILNKFLSK